MMGFYVANIGSKDGLKRLVECGEKLTVRSDNRMYQPPWNGTVAVRGRNHPVWFWTANVKIENGIITRVFG